MRNNIFGNWIEGTSTHRYPGYPYPIKFFLQDRVTTLIHIWWRRSKHLLVLTAFWSCYACYAGPQIGHSLAVPSGLRMFRDLRFHHLYLRWHHSSRQPLNLLRSLLLKHLPGFGSPHLANHHRSKELEAAEQQLVLGSNSESCWPAAPVSRQQLSSSSCC